MCRSPNFQQPCLQYALSVACSLSKCSENLRYHTSVAKLAEFHSASANADPAETVKGNQGLETTGLRSKVGLRLSCFKPSPMSFLSLPCFHNMWSLDAACCPVLSLVAYHSSAEHGIGEAVLTPWNGRFATVLFTKFRHTTKHIQNARNSGTPVYITTLPVFFRRFVLYLNMSYQQPRMRLSFTYTTGNHVDDLPSGKLT